eukprot:2834694-Karenia_brevis.AAC.1
MESQTMHLAQVLKQKEEEEVQQIRVQAQALAHAKERAEMEQQRAAAYALQKDAELAQVKQQAEQEISQMQQQAESVVQNLSQAAMSSQAKADGLQQQLEKQSGALAPFKSRKRAAVAADQEAAVHIDMAADDGDPMSSETNAGAVSAAEVPVISDGEELSDADHVDVEALQAKLQSLQNSPQ